MRSLLFLPLLALVLTGCSYNFEDFTPPGDARVTDTAADGTALDTSTGDARVTDSAVAPKDGTALDTSTDTVAADTAPIDTGCMLPSGDSCLVTARSCSMTCAATRATCEAACGNPACTKGCRATETSCKSTCVSDCTTCTTAAGCPSAARCAVEVG